MDAAPHAVPPKRLCGRSSFRRVCVRQGPPTTTWRKLREQGRNHPSRSACVAADAATPCNARTTGSASLPPAATTGNHGCKSTGTVPRVLSTPGAQGAYPSAVSGQPGRRTAAAAASVVGSVGAGIWKLEKILCPGGRQLAVASCLGLRCIDIARRQQSRFESAQQCDRRGSGPAQPRARLALLRPRRRDPGRGGTRRRARRAHTPAGAGRDSERSQMTISEGSRIR